MVLEFAVILRVQRAAGRVGDGTSPGSGGRLGFSPGPARGRCTSAATTISSTVTSLRCPRRTTPISGVTWRRPASGWALELQGITTTDIEVPFDAPSPEKAWEMLRISTGRVADGYALLEPAARAAMDREMIEFFRTYRKPDGKVKWPRKAVMIRATRLKGDPARKDNLMRSGIAVLAGTTWRWPSRWC